MYSYSYTYLLMEAREKFVRKNVNISDLAVYVYWFTYNVATVAKL